MTVMKTKNTQLIVDKHGVDFHHRILMFGVIGHVVKISVGVIGFFVDASR